MAGEQQSALAAVILMGIGIRATLACGACERAFTVLVDPEQQLSGPADTSGATNTSLIGAWGALWMPKDVLSEGVFAIGPRVLGPLETLKSLQSQGAMMKPLVASGAGMKIGELSSATGVDTETIRYYEKIGLLAPPARHSNGYRDYGAEHVESLSFVRHCRALDIPLADVERLLAFTSNTGEDCGDINHLIDEQIKRVRARLNSFKALERQLTILRGRCKDKHTVRECGILHELVAAAHGEACACHPG